MGDPDQYTCVGRYGRQRDFCEMAVELRRRKRERGWTEERIRRDSTFWGVVGVAWAFLGPILFFGGLIWLLASGL